MGDPHGEALRKAIEKVRRSIEKVRPFARQGLSESRKKPKGLVAADETSLGGELPRPHDGGSGPGVAVAHPSTKHRWESTEIGTQSPVKKTLHW